jgi:hypothetical protein
MQNLLFGMSASSVNSHTMTLGYYKDNQKYPRYNHNNILKVFFLPFFIFLRCFFMLFQATISLHQSTGQTFKTLPQALLTRWNILTAALKLNCLTAFLSLYCYNFWSTSRCVMFLHAKHINLFCGVIELWQLCMVNLFQFMIFNIILLHCRNFYFIQQTWTPTTGVLKAWSTDLEGQWDYLLFSYYKEKYCIEYF